VQSSLCYSGSSCITVSSNEHCQPLPRQLAMPRSFQFEMTAYGFPARKPLDTKNSESRYSSLVTSPLSGTTPSRIQTEYAPISFAITISVNRRSPITAICEGEVRRSPKCARISAEQAGLGLECRRTFTPVLRSSKAASMPSGSLERVPEELDTIKILEGEYCFTRAWNLSCRSHYE